MNRVEAIFSDLRRTRRAGLMPFITAGYPSLDATAAIIPALERGGAHICEIGFPFSDPIADGPIIQASMTHALSRGVHPADIFGMVRSIRDRVKIGLVAMVSYSIVFRIGVERFIGQAADAGFDGFIFPDLPLEEAEAVAGLVTQAGLISSLLISPTTPDDRAARIARASSGFIYLLARTGITGERSTLPEGLAERIARLRSATDLPIAVGFGIATAEHVRGVTQVADAAIVGSALVRRITQHIDEPPQAIASHAAALVADLAAGLPGVPQPVHR